MNALRETASKIGGFGTGIWQYWRRGTPAPNSNFVVQKLYAYTDGRSNDFSSPSRVKAQRSRCKVRLGR